MYNELYYNILYIQYYIRYKLLLTLRSIAKRFIPYDIHGNKHCDLDTKIIP